MRTQYQLNDSPLKNWIPWKIIKTNGQFQCSWLNTFGTLFTEPFFEETILKCITLDSHYSKLASFSDLIMMDEWANYLDFVEPTAFVFHVSRCGSTLVAQLLAESEQNIVLSEVPFFDDILRLPFKEPVFDQTASSELLTAAIKFYGQKKTGKEEHLFIKTDSWHLFFYKQLRQLYPSIPFILIYRSPDEVFRSHRKQPGMQSVRGLIEPEVFGFTAEDLEIMSPDDYLAGVLESYLRKYLEIAETDNLCLLLNYNEGPIPMLEKIAAFTNTTPSRQELLKMTERSLYHSKKPRERFSEETITHAPACLGKAMELYHRLEEKRLPGV
jgi:hypothetical protein